MDDALENGTLATAIEVMNGYVRVNDVVCYPTRQGSSTEMRIARVTGIEQAKRYSWDDETVPVLKVRVMQTTDYVFGEFKPYDTTIRVIDRVVKLNG